MPENRIIPRRRMAPLLAAVLIVLIGAAVAEACPNCKEAVAQGDPRQQNLAAGFYYSILFMMSMPFLLIGSFGGCMYLRIRKAQAAQEGGDCESR